MHPLQALFEFAQVDGLVVPETMAFLLAWQEERLDPQQVVEYAARMGNRAVIKRFGFIVEQLGLASLEETEPWQEALSQGYSPLEPQLPTRGRY
jgi:predicted transcriptional regulator of viral defense system